MAAAGGPFQAITKATVSPAEEDSVRKEAELLLKPDAKWEELFMPAPASVAILGELACLCARQKADVSIKENCPEDGFKYIKHPESFRACLHQMCDRTGEALNQLYVKMDGSRLHSMFVSRKMNQITQGFFQNAQAGRDQLQSGRQNIQNKAEKCTESAQAMRDVVSEVISLAQEMLLACQEAEHGCEQDLTDVQQKLRKAKEMEQSVRKAMEDAQLKQKLTEGNIKQALSKIEKALTISFASCCDISSGVSDKTEWIKEQISKVESRGEALRGSQAEEHRSFENTIKLMKEQTELLCELKASEMSERDLETTKEMLIERRVALAKAEEQWEKMLQLSCMISNLIQFCFTWDIEECLASAEGIQQATHAFNASNVAWMLYMITKIFTQVYTDHLLDLLHSSGKILTLEPSDPDFSSEHAKIDRGCAEAQKAISSLVLEMKEEFKRNLTAGQETIEKMKAAQHP
uniref:Uncharacterized LOC102452791 n=1 Tax=Pelodiscus sinensis TaxID=13735 RepID=K7EZQ5_PELSI|nr:uncharacterized protein LOC102452791 [Pelodiscus sinensis]|eukprot:XP_006114787.1 uncharacterized protein LOC102452791 [Pelodiscus sinensis]